MITGMIWVGFVLLAGVLYECGVAATFTCIRAIPKMHQNYWHHRYPMRMSLLFPVSLFLFNIVPYGFRRFYIACLVMQLGSLFTWLGLGIAFLFFPWTWWLLGVTIATTFVASFFVPQDMIDVMRNSKPFELKYLPKNRTRK